MQTARFWVVWLTLQQQSLPHLKSWILENPDMGLKDLHLHFGLQY